MERCSFCGKTKDQVERLIQGGGKQPAGSLPVVYICNKCIDLCSHIIREPPNDSTPSQLTDWAHLAVDGVRYRWSAVRTIISEEGTSTPMVMILVGRSGEEAVGVLHPDGTQPTEALAVEAIRRMFIVREQ